MNTRRNRITGEPFLYVPERAARPGAFGRNEETRCPFCPGNESDTPPTIASEGDPWNVRVFGNKYPPSPGAEVIVEARDHGATFGSVRDPLECVTIYRDRSTAHEDAPYVALFKNEGSGAGASIAHVHSQLVPLPFVPPRVQRELEGFERAGHCPLCTPGDAIIIGESPGFRWEAPSDSSMPYQQRIIPNRHVQNLAALGDRELTELAEMLQQAARATIRIAHSYNWMFLTFPGERAAHMYIELIPRVTAIAGLELVTGTFVEIIDPADAARRLRETG